MIKRRHNDIAESNYAFYRGLCLLLPLISPRYSPSEECYLYTEAWVQVLEPRLASRIQSSANESQNMDSILTNQRTCLISVNCGSTKFGMVCERLALLFAYVQPSRHVALLYPLIVLRSFQAKHIPGIRCPSTVYEPKLCNFLLIGAMQACQEVENSVEWSTLSPQRDTTS